MSQDAPLSPSSPPEGSITIRVRSKDNGELHFQLSPSQRLGRVFDRVCTYIDPYNSHNELVFLHDGQRLDPNMAPADAGLTDGDAIDALPRQSGGQGPLLPLAGEPVTLEVLVDEMVSSPWASKAGVDAGMAAGVWRALTQHIEAALHTGRNVAVPHLGSFVVASAIDTRSGREAGFVRPFFEIVLGRFSGVRMRCLRYAPASRGAGAQPSLVHIQKESGVSRKLAYEIIRELVRRMGAHMNARARPIKVAFPGLGHLVTDGRMQLAFKFERALLESILKDKGGDAERAPEPLPPSRFPEGSVEGAVDRLARRCRAEDTSRSGMVARMSLEAWLDEAVQAGCEVLGSLPSSTLLRLLREATYGRSKSFIEYRAFLEALTDALGDYVAAPPPTAKAAAAPKRGKDAHAHGHGHGHGHGPAPAQAASSAAGPHGGDRASIPDPADFAHVEEEVLPTARGAGKSVVRGRSIGRAKEAWGAAPPAPAPAAAPVPAPAPAPAPGAQDVPTDEDLAASDSEVVPGAPDYLRQAQLPQTCRAAEKGHDVTEEWQPGRGSDVHMSAEWRQARGLCDAFNRAHFGRLYNALGWESSVMKERVYQAEGRWGKMGRQAAVTPKIGQDPLMQEWAEEARERFVFDKPERAVELEEQVEARREAELIARQNSRAMAVQRIEQELDAVTKEKLAAAEKRREAVARMRSGWDEQIRVQRAQREQARASEGTWPYITRGSHAKVALLDQPRYIRPLHKAAAGK